MSEEPENLEWPYGEGERRQALDFLHFPAPFQAVIWRNWGLVSAQKLGEVLHTSVEMIDAEAERLGLPPSPPVDPRWPRLGYMTILRKNWHLLSYEQLALILGWSREKFLFHLKEDDALWHKLGDCKPCRPLILYTPLSLAQLAKTECLREMFSSAPVFNAFAFVDALEHEPLRHRELVVSPLGDGDLRRGIMRWAAEAQFDPIVNVYFTRYAGRWATQWGIKEQKNGIVFDLCFEQALGKEDYALDISAERLLLMAGHERGILRALQFIDRMMTARCAPVLEPGRHEARSRYEVRMIYPYHITFGDPLLEIGQLPEGLLERYSDLGINALWLHVVLQSLYAPKDVSLPSEEIGTRLQNLRQLAKQAREYGIDLLLYLNEPRALAIENFISKQDLKGVEFDLGGESTGHALHLSSLRTRLSARSDALSVHADSRVGRSVHHYNE